MEAPPTLINCEDAVVRFITGMVQDWKLVNYPRNEKTMTIGAKRKNIESNMAKILEEYDAHAKAHPEETSLIPKQTGNNSNNMRRFRISNTKITSMNMKFVEVQARVCPGGGKFKNSITPNRVSSIDFLGSLHGLIMEKLVKNLEEDLTRNHHVTLDGNISTIAMYVERHSNTTCKLRCKKVLAEKVETFQDECLSQQIALGSYFFPFLDEEAQEDDVCRDEHSGILGNLMMRNGTLFGLGHNLDFKTRQDMFVDKMESVMHAIISCSPYEVGVFANKQMILYMEQQGRVFYAPTRPSKMKSTKSVVLDILNHVDHIRGRVKVECVRQEKELPEDMRLDFSNKEEVDGYIAKMKRKKGEEEEEEEEETDDEKSKIRWKEHHPAGACAER